MQKNIQLLLDTSTDLLVLGLFTDTGKLLGMHRSVHENNLSKTLLPGIDSLLKEQGLAVKDLSRIVFGIGPGSYTGTRVGAAVAKSLGFALQISVQGFASPLAFIPKEIDGAFSFLIPTRAGPVFVLQGSCALDGLKINSPYFSTSADLALHIKNRVCISSQPKEFSFSCLAPELNLGLLIPFLISNDLPEDPELLYLHEL